MGENTSATSDLDEEPEPIVAVRDQKRWQFACVLIALAVVILYLVFIFTAHLLVPEWLAKMGLWPSDTAACFCALLLSVIQIQIFLLAKNRYAEFAVWKDGLTLKTVRIGPKGSIQRRRDIGFYSWKEVSCCSWSHFDPDKLIVQLRSTTDPERPEHLVRHRQRDVRDHTADVLFLSGPPAIPRERGEGHPRVWQVGCLSSFAATKRAISNTKP